MSQLLNDVMRTFRFADAVDICIVAILIYLLISWVQVRSARSIVLPLIVVVAVYWTARGLDLYLTATIFQFGFLGVMIAFILVFQQDIRREFERFSTWSFLRRREDTANASVDAVVDAIVFMAERKIGALLVLPGDEPIERHVRGGVTVDANLSMTLLCSIFNPTSPGHDGAVTIERDRIGSLGIHLPLSDNLSQVPNGGTRHAAALGLAERCDALLVVVSEERGTVSLAENGQLRQVELEELRNRLRERNRSSKSRDSPSESSKGRLKVGQLFAAVALAALTWLAFAYQTETIQKTIVVPIEYRGLPEQLIVGDPGVTYAQITLRGPEQAFDSLDPSKVAVSLDLSDAAKGDHFYEPTAESIKNLPRELRILDLQPRQVRLFVQENSSPESGGK